MIVFVLINVSTGLAKGKWKKAEDADAKGVHYPDFSGKSNYKNSLFRIFQKYFIIKINFPL